MVLPDMIPLSLQTFIQFVIAVLIFQYLSSQLHVELELELGYNSIRKNPISLIFGILKE